MDALYRLMQATYLDDDDETPYMVAKVLETPEHRFSWRRDPQGGTPIQVQDNLWEDWDAFESWLNDNYEIDVFSLVYNFDEGLTHVYDSNSDSPVIRVGLTVDKDTMAKLDPNQVDTVEVAVRKNAAGEYVSDEKEFRYIPENVWIPDQKLFKQMPEQNPQLPVIQDTQPPSSPEDIIYSSQNKPPSGSVPTHTGARGGEYWLRSEALSSMNWDEDELNRYLNTEQEEIQSESLESLQEQLPQVVEEVKQLRGEKNRKYRIYQSAKSAMNRGELAEEEVQKRRDSYKSSKDDLDEGQVKLDLLNEKIEGLTADSVEMPSEESLEDIEPEQEVTIDNLKSLLKDDPEAKGENKSDILSILEKFSDKERDARAEINEVHEEEYYSHPAVQDAIEAISLVSETTNWRNLDAIAELPIVSDMRMEGSLDSKISILHTRLDAYNTIGSEALQHFEKTYSLPSFNIDGTPADVTTGDWRQAPLEVPSLSKLLQTNSLSKNPDVPDDYVWFTKSQLNRKFTLSQMSTKSRLRYKRDVATAKRYGESPPDKDSYLVGGDFEEIALDDILLNLDRIVATSVRNKSTGASRSIKFMTRTRSDGKSRDFSLSADVLNSIQQIVIDELPDNFGPPSVSSTFKNKFKEIARPYAVYPANDTDHLISELYGATKFGKFHSESSAAMEKSTNSLLGGLIKDAIGTVTNSKIIYHGDNKVTDSNGNLVVLEEGYKRFPREYVQEYVKVHKQLTRQLLDYMYPDDDAIELYRGTQDAQLKSQAKAELETKKSNLFQRLMNRGAQGTQIRVEHNPVTLYSSNHSAAYDFSIDQRASRPSEVDMEKPVSEAAQGQGGLVLVHQVPKEDIWSSFGTGHGGVFRKGTEGEFYVSGTGRPSTVTAYLPSDFYEYIQKQGGTFQKQQEQLPQQDEEENDFILVIDDAVNSDWIQKVNELWEPIPDVGTKSHMSPIKVPPTNVDDASFAGQKIDMPKIPVEAEEIIETTPTVQKALVYKQESLGQTLAQSDPDKASVPKEESAIHPAAQGKVRTVIYELVHRAGKTFERRRTAWVTPKVAEATASRQKASDWLRLLGNYLPLYFVGGFVRDKLMGKVSKDVDIIALAPLEQVAESFDSLNIEYKKVSARNKKLLTLQVAGMDVDIVSAEADDLPADLMKRDFTINAVAQSVTGQFYDPSNGLADIKAKILRSPRNQSDKRFKEDPLRMMRGARFIGEYNLKPHPSVIRAIEKNKDKLKDMPKARIGKELSKIMGVEKPHVALEFMAKHKLLGAIDPAMEDMVGYKQNTPHHKWNLWKHTMSSLKSSDSEDMVLNLAILFHDIGKPDAADDKQSTFHGHETYSAKHAASILKQLEFSPDIVKRVENLVGMHMRLLTIPIDSGSKAFRRLKIQAGEDLQRLIALAKADITGSGVKVASKLEQLDAVVDKLKSIEDLPSKKNLSPLSGEDIINHLGVNEGPQIGDIKQHLHNLVVDGELEHDDEDKAMKEARNYMEMITKELDFLTRFLSYA